RDMGSELRRLGARGRKFALAADLFRRVAMAPELPEFLTGVAYEYLDCHRAKLGQGRTVGGYHAALPGRRRRPATRHTADPVHARESWCGPALGTAARRTLRRRSFSRHRKPSGAGSPRWAQSDLHQRLAGRGG